MAPRQPVLVTGRAGDSGGHMVRLLRAAGHHVAYDGPAMGCPRAARGAEMLRWRPRHDDLGLSVRTAWNWERWLRGCGRPDAPGAVCCARPIAELRAR
jgi:UDP-glucose 4-epimerase